MFALTYTSKRKLSKHGENIPSDFCSEDDITIICYVSAFAILSYFGVSFMLDITKTIQYPGNTSIYELFLFRISNASIRSVPYH